MRCGVRCRWSRLTGPGSGWASADGRPTGSLAGRDRRPCVGHLCVDRCRDRPVDLRPGVDPQGGRGTVDAPNRLWITDITEHPTGDGKLYCAAVMDAYSRLIIGWSIAPHMRA